MKKTVENKESKLESKNAKIKVAEAEEQSPEEILKARKHEPKPTAPKSKAAKREVKAAAKIPRVQLDPLRKRSKQYRAARAQIESGREYSLDEALALLPKTSFVKFDPSVECHVPLNVDPKQADQLVRGMVVLPHSSGKAKRVAVVTTEANFEKAKQAGADKVGEDDLLEEISKGKFDFDILVATPDAMPKLAKQAKQLGPKGLMPNPKSGTVTTDIAKTIKELRGGRLEFRVDPQGIMHLPIGKLSLKPEQLKANFLMLYEAIKTARPGGIKGGYIKRVWLSTSMGPAIRIDTKKL